MVFPQASSLRSLLFLTYVNDLFKASNLLLEIMFANNTSGFLSHKNIDIHFASSHFLVICFLDYRSTLDPQQLKTNTFEWMLDNIRIEKIISTPIWATNVFWRFQLYYMLDIVPNCNLVQYQDKL